MTDYSSMQLIPERIILDAKQGDPTALDAVIRYYRGYIDTLCRKVSQSSDGQYRSEVDLYMRRQLEIKLISAILGMKY